MTPQRLAYAMASRVLRERQRIARKLFEISNDSDFESVPRRLEEYAEELMRNPSLPTPEPPASPPPSETQAPLFVEEPEDGLPGVHHLDDFAEGRALVQGSMHRRGLTGRLHR